MQASWLRRALLAAACLSAVVVAACGGGDVVSPFNPSRVIAFGDAFSDVGQRGSRYTVNGPGATNWNDRVAARYGLPLTASAAGGQSYATGNARIATVPDVAGDATTPSIAGQINNFLATQSFGASDLVLVNGGTADIVAEAAAVGAGTRTEAQARAATEQAAVALAAQVKRMVDAGARRIGVVGTYDLGRSPYALQTGQAARLANLSAAFNVKLKTELFGYNVAEQVLYIDAEFYYNLVVQNPGSSTYASINNVTEPACNSVDPGPGIGTGAGQVNSALCTAATLVPGRDPATTLFADRLYFTPSGNSIFGDYAYDRLRSRW